MCKYFIIWFAEKNSSYAYKLLPYFISFWAGCDLLICNGSLLRFYFVLTPYGTLPDEHFFFMPDEHLFLPDAVGEPLCFSNLNYQMFQASHYASLIINYPMSDFLLGTSLHSIVHTIYPGSCICMHCTLIQRENRTQTWWTERSAWMIYPMELAQNLSRQHSSIRT
jgi:hypothetical protein